MEGKMSWFRLEKPKSQELVVIDQKPTVRQAMVQAYRAKKAEIETRPPPKSYLPVRSLTWEKRELSKEEVAISYGGKVVGRAIWNEVHLSWAATMKYSARKRDGGSTEFDCYVYGASIVDEACKLLNKQFLRMAEREGWYVQ
jgi:hypothetical protein